MEKLPPELCLRVMELIPCLQALGNFILSHHQLFRVFSNYRGAILTTVIGNQFAGNANDAVFLATGQALGAISEDARVDVVKRLRRFAWAHHHLDSGSLKKLSQIGQIVDELTAVFTDRMAAELWAQAAHNKPPKFHCNRLKSMVNAEIRMRKVLYQYWILSELYSQFVSPRICFFRGSSLDRGPFEEFYRLFSKRELFHIAFFEFCFFPHFMKYVCGECKDGTCDGTLHSGVIRTDTYGTLGQIHRSVFRAGPTELMRVYRLHYTDRSLTRDHINEDVGQPKGLWGDLLHGIEISRASIIEGPLDPCCFTWAFFELDGLDESEQEALNMNCESALGM